MVLVLDTCGESGSSAFGVGARRTSSCRTTSAKTTSRLGRIERFCGKRFLENSFSQTAELGEQPLGEQLLTNGSHELEDEPRIPSLRTLSLFIFVCSHVHIAERVLYPDCAEKGFCCASSTLCGPSGLVYPHQIKSRASTHAVSRNTPCKECRYRLYIRSLHRQPITNNTMYMRCSDRTHGVHASVSRKEEIHKNAILKGLGFRV